MRPASALLQLSVCLSTFTPLTAAWSGNAADWHMNLARADETTGTTAAQTDQPSSTSKPGKTIKTTNLNTAGITESSNPTETGKDKGSKTTQGATSTPTTFAPNDPPGGISLITPVTTLQATPLYKISDYITFAWNYTSLQGTPTAIDVLVSCSAASETWTLTGNMSFVPEPTYVWDTKKQANDVQQPLPAEMYTLIIKDSNAEITDMPSPGYLGSYQGLKFGLYAKQTDGMFAQPTIPCIGCNAAMPAFDGQPVKLALAMSVISLLSFTWFVAGLGLH